MSADGGGATLPRKNVFAAPRGSEQLTLWRLVPAPWRDTMVALVIWHGIIFKLRTIAPLTRGEACMDLRALARGGPLPSRYELAERWGWQGEAGASRARRLAESLEWMDMALEEWNVKQNNGL